MKITYDTIDKGNNMFISIPTKVEACCPESMIWFFKSASDVNVKEAALIKKDITNNSVADVFFYCQFCGSKHVTEKAPEVTNTPHKKTKNIK